VAAAFCGVRSATLHFGQLCWWHTRPCPWCYQGWSISTGHILMPCRVPATGLSGCVRAGAAKDSVSASEVAHVAQLPKSRATHVLRRRRVPSMIKGCSTTLWQQPSAGCAPQRCTVASFAGGTRVLAWVFPGTEHSTGHILMPCRITATGPSGCVRAGAAKDLSVLSRQLPCAVRQCSQTVYGYVAACLSGQQQQQLSSSQHRTAPA
jgi:hypothetical protein